MTRLHRLGLLSLGVVSLGLGLIGIVVPLLPTTPLVLLAAWCFAKAHPAWEARMLDHPRWGPMITQWRSRGAIPLPAKVMAVGMLVASAVFSLWWLTSAWTWALVMGLMLLAFWIATRPSA